ncbi:hypothetical protein QNH39_27770 [Neobacillus novalis]|uniref:Uncharacterized protein n=1 Tax=Neobacillus novalis TaxID=220687 RepID=A0AA95MQ45_9BACI|nr:hypothetical protein [Neobacillus novalis]WHY86319.1 hypothetical protein QNH39_27770 [Neobacillus novalis]
MKKNLGAIKQLLGLYRNQELVINREVLKMGFTNRTFKLNDNVFTCFTNFCKEQYPQYRIQDLIGQALWEFVKKYSK